MTSKEKVKGATSDKTYPAEISHSCQSYFALHVSKRPSQPSVADAASSELETIGTRSLFCPFFMWILIRLEIAVLLDHLKKRKHSPSQA